MERKTSRVCRVCEVTLVCALSFAFPLFAVQLRRKPDDVLFFFLVTLLFALLSFLSGRKDGVRAYFQTFYSRVFFFVMLEMLV